MFKYLCYTVCVAEIPLVHILLTVSLKMGLNLMKGVYLEFVFHQSSTCLTFRKECTLEWNDMEKGNRYAFFRKSIEKHGYLYF